MDDILAIHENPKIILDKLGTMFRLKNGIEEPKLYLGADLRNGNIRKPMAQLANAGQSAPAAT